MVLLRDGNPHAFEVIYDRHGGAAFSLAYRMVGDRNVGRGRHPGGVPVDVAQPRALRPRARQRAHLGARDRPPPDDRRAARATSPTTAGDDRRGPRGTPGGARAHRVEVARRDEARRSARRSRRCPASSARSFDSPTSAASPTPRSPRCSTMPIGTVKGRMRLGLEKMRRQLAEGCAAEHRRDRERPPRYRDDVGAYLLGALEPAEQRGLRGPPGGLRRMPRRGRAAAGRAADALPRSVEPGRAAGGAEGSLMEPCVEDARPRSAEPAGRDGAAPGSERAAVAPAVRRRPAFAAGAARRSCSSPSASRVGALVGATAASDAAHDRRERRPARACPRAGGPLDGPTATTAAILHVEGMQRPRPARSTRSGSSAAARSRRRRTSGRRRRERRGGDPGRRSRRRRGAGHARAGGRVEDAVRAPVLTVALS